MSNLPVDRDSDYMYRMWGTTKLVTDYDGFDPSKKIIKEVMYDDMKHDFNKQNEIHKVIRNSDDYDDWEYGTEPNYGSAWK